jgi:truncated hemoglobin YjbI
VYEDEEEWFREIFSGSKKEDAIQNQYEFLVQRMGGPPLFSQRRGNSINPASLTWKALFISSGRFLFVPRTTYGSLQ